MCQLTEVSEVMELLRSVEANGLGLLIFWALLVALLMVCKSSMAACSVISTRIMLRDSEMVVLNTYRMVIRDGLAGLVMATMVL